VVQGGLAPLALRPEPVTSSLVLAASELVSNAYRYGRSGSAINLRLAAYDAMIRMEVRNEGALFRPRLRQADDDDIGGRGLLLVASVCDRFGTTHTPTHVTVWCEVDVSAEL
jgi:anti-sigma regulatory factor (Ser/Thr protein kinase)